MENVTDALKMAAAVLVFVLALSISINAFGQARVTARTILDYKDREYDYTYVENNGTTQRIVGAETIVPSIYKAYKENFKIVFKNADGTGLCLYERKDENSTTGKVEVYSIDLEKDVIGTDQEKETFIRCLLYGGNPENYAKIDELKETSGIILPKENFYDRIKGYRFRESLGVYYQGELEGTSNVPEANQTKKRVITYQIIS